MALTDNLVAYYKLDDLTDSSGNGFTLTNNGSTPFNPAKINNGADGGSANTTKYLSILSNLGIDGGAMSYSCWVNITTQLSGANETRVILSLGSDGTDVTYHLHYMTETSVKKIGFNRLKNGVADGYTYYPTTLNTGTWYHIVTTYDGTTSTIYLNGTSVASSAQSGSGTGTTTNRFFIMESTQSPGAGVMLNGLVDEVGVWNRALSANEVLNLYRNGAGNAYQFLSPTNSFNNLNTPSVRTSSGLSASERIM